MGGKKIKIKKIAQVQHLCLKGQRVLKSLSGLLAKAGRQAPTQMLSHCPPHTQWDKAEKKMHKSEKGHGSK